MPSPHPSPLPTTGPSSTLVNAILGIREPPEPSFTKTFYIHGIENSIETCKAPSTILSQAGAFICGGIKPASATGGYSTACAQIDFAQGSAPITYSNPCKSEDNCLTCGDGNFCATHYLKPAEDSMLPLSQLFCAGARNYVETWWETPFLRRLAAATDSDELDPRPVTKSSSSQAPTSISAASRDVTTGLCPTPGNAAAAAIETSCANVHATPSPGVLAAVAVPSILGTLALASLVFYLLLRSRTRKMIGSAPPDYDTSNGKMGALGVQEESMMHRRLSNG